MVCVELTDKKQTKMRESWFPGLVVSPNAQVANIPYRDSVTRLLGGYFRSKLYFIVDCRLNNMAISVLVSCFIHNLCETISTGIVTSVLWILPVSILNKREKYR